MTQNNLAIAYSKSCRHAEPVSNLRRAIEAYQAALVYYTPESAPLDYAMTQNNLAAAYQVLARHEEPVPNLRRAIEAYQAALVYRTPESAPLAYATDHRQHGAAALEQSRVGET